jgi:hypothetical protein
VGPDPLLGREVECDQCDSGHESDRQNADECERYEEQDFTLSTLRTRGGRLALITVTLRT